MRAIRVARPHPSRRAYARSSLRNVFGIRAPQDEDEHRVLQSSPHKQPFSFPRRMSAPGVCDFASLTPNEGWAERRETFGCCAKHPLGVHIARERRAPRHALAGPIPVFSCFSADSESSIPGLMISSTHTSSFPRRMSAPGVCTFASLTRKEGGRSAERRSGACEAPVGRIMCVKDARERAFDAIRQALARRLASHDAGRSPLGAPPWRFFTRGRASVFRHDPEPYSELLAARS